MGGSSGALLWGAVVGQRRLRPDVSPPSPLSQAFQAALQTQWSWMLQLCCCIEAHLKENSAYFQVGAGVPTGPPPAAAPPRLGCAALLTPLCPPSSLPT